jgi:superfamily I DNA and/or RNA helicase
LLQLLVELERLLIVAEKYRQGGGGYHRTEGQLRRQLETSFAREAEVVFTTLSSSGREIFERLGHGFDTVVIDEAAQVSAAPLVGMKCHSSAVTQECCC